MSYHIQTMVLFEGHLFLSPWPWLGFCLLQIHFSRSGQTSQLFLRDLYPVTDSTGGSSGLLDQSIGFGPLLSLHDCLSSALAH